MVGKIVSSSAPYSCANYSLNHDEATILCWEGLDIDPTEAAELARSTGEARLQLASAMAYAIDTSFSIQAETNTEVQKPVGHISAHLQSSVFKLSNDLIDSIHEEGIVAYTS